MLKEALVLGNEDELQKIRRDLRERPPGVPAGERRLSVPAGFGGPQEHERGERRIDVSDERDLKDGEGGCAQERGAEPNPPAAPCRRACRPAWFQRLRTCGGGMMTGRTRGIFSRPSSPCIG